MTTESTTGHLIKLKKRQDLSSHHHCAGVNSKSTQGIKKLSPKMVRNLYLTQHIEQFYLVIILSDALSTHRPEYFNLI